MGKKKHIRGAAIKLEFPKAVEEKAKITHQVYHQQNKVVPNRPNLNGGNQQALQQALQQHAGSVGSRPESVITETDCEVALDRFISKAKDRDSFQSALAEWEVALKCRNELRQKNVKPDYEAFEKLIEDRKLDSTLKKCSGFVKRLRSFTSSQRSVIEKEYETLNLTKFLGEISCAITMEARLRTCDVPDVVHISSGLHQRYRDFSGLMLDEYKKVLQKGDATTSYMSKLSVDLRIIGELVVTGFFSSNSGYSILLSYLKHILNTDKDGQQFMIPLLSFVRSHGIELAGIMPRNISKLCTDCSTIWPTLNAVPSDKAVQMQSLLSDYFNVVSQTIVKLNEDVLTSETANRKLLKTKGEISKEREEEHADLVGKFERFGSNAKKLSRLLNLPLPSLRGLEPEPEPEQCKIVFAAEKGEGAAGITPGLILFDCEETRSFYQDLPDMKVYLPQVAYRDNIIQAAHETEAIAEREKEAANVDVDTEVAELATDIFPSTEAEEPPSETEELPLSMQPEEEKPEEKIRPNFQAFLLSLSNCVNQRMIDQAAIEFVDKFNNKPNRKKLVSVLFRIPRQRVDLLPLWSRFVAILAPVMPSIYLDLCTMLYKDFRYLIRKKEQMFVETKLKITRFIGELVNFGLFPKADAFQCFKMLLMDFVHHQVEMACAFVETCGKVLHRSPDTHRRMHIYLEEMMRKKTVRNLEPRYISMVDHAYFFVCPPESTKIVIRIPLILAYIQDTVASLSKKTLEYAIDKLRALAWDNPETKRYAVECFTEAGDYTNTQFRLCASLLAALVPFQNDLSVQVVDAVMEDIHLKMDSTDVRMNHHRMSTIIYFGELYSYKLVGSSLVFHVLYEIITYGVVMDYSVKSTLDPPENLFRVRLACTLLKTCGEFFTQGSAKQKLVFYLKYLQRYYWFKKNHKIFQKRPFPHAITETFEDTFQSLRPRAKLAQTFEEACDEIDKVESKFKEQFQREIQQAQHEYDARLEKYVLMSEARGDACSHSVPASSSNPFVQLDESIIEEQDPDALSRQQEAEFNRMYEQMCTVPSSTRNVQADIPVPIYTQSMNASTVNSEPVYSESGEKLVNFSLLTKAKGKRNVKTLLIPESSEYVKKIREREEVEKSERAAMKKLTLGMTEKQEEEEMEAETKARLKAIAYARQLPIKKFSNPGLQFQYR